MRGCGEIERPQMRVEQRGLRSQPNRNLHKLDLPLHLDLEMDRIVLRPLLLELRLVRCGHGVDLCPRLYGQ